MANRRKSAAELQATGAMIEHPGRYSDRSMSWEPPATFNDPEREAWEMLRRDFPVLDAQFRLDVETLARVMAKPKRTAIDDQNVLRTLRALRRAAGKAATAPRRAGYHDCEFANWSLREPPKPPEYWMPGGEWDRLQGKIK